MSRDWKSQESVLHSKEIYTGSNFTLIGLYTWELLLTSHFDWLVITGQRPFRWPMLLYYNARIWPLVNLAMACIHLNTEVPVDCHMAFLWAAIAALPVACCASGILMMRAIAVWERRLIVVIPLLVILLGQAACFAVSCALLKAHWDDENKICIIDYSEPKSITGDFVITLILDGIVLALTAGRLLYLSRGAPSFGVTQILFRDGLLYFVATFFVNVLPAVMAIIKLNDIMNVVFAPVSAAISAAIACRLFVKLNMYNEQHGTHSDLTPNPSRSGSRSPGNLSSHAGRRTRPHLGGITVTYEMDRIEDSDSQYNQRHEQVSDAHSFSS